VFVFYIAVILARKLKYPTCFALVRLTRPEHTGAVMILFTCELERNLHDTATRLRVSARIRVVIRRFMLGRRGADRQARLQICSLGVQGLNEVQAVTEMSGHSAVCTLAISSTIILLR